MNLHLELINGRPGQQGVTNSLIIVVDTVIRREMRIAYGCSQEAVEPVRKKPPTICPVSLMPWGT